MAIKIDEISSLLGLTPSGAQVYIELLTHGELSLKELMGFLSLSQKAAISAIQELLEQEFIYEISDSAGEKVYQALSLPQLEEKVARDKTILSNLKKIVLPRMQDPPKLGIIKYEGMEGIRKVFVEVLDEARKCKEDILAFESSIDVESLGQTFIQNYIQKRLEQKTTAYVITPDSALDQQYKRDFDGNFTYVKLLSDFPMKANINITGNLVMTFTLDPAQGTLRRNPDEAQTFKAIFHHLWGQ